MIKIGGVPVKKGTKVILVNGRGSGVVRKTAKGKIYVDMDDSPILLSFTPKEISIKPKTHEVIVDLSSIRLSLTEEEYHLAIEMCQIPNSVNEKLLTILTQRVKSGEGIIERFEED